MRVFPTARGGGIGRVFTHFLCANFRGNIIVTAASSFDNSDQETMPTTTRTTVREAKQRQTAEPIKFILDRETRAVVGWLYKWNTGALVPMWKDGKRQNVIYE